MDIHLVAKNYINAGSAYEKIDETKLAYLCERHEWIVKPIYRASDTGTNLHPKFNFDGSVAN